VFLMIPVHFELPLALGVRPVYLEFLCKLLEPFLWFLALPELEFRQD